MVVVAVAAAQVPLVTVQVKVFAPITSPDTPDVGEFGVVIVAPDGLVQTPVPTEPPAVTVPVVTLHND